MYGTEWEIPVASQTGLVYVSYENSIDCFHHDMQVPALLSTTRSHTRNFYSCKNQNVLLILNVGRGLKFGKIFLRPVSLTSFM